jgi:hypothetical protein
VSFVWGKRDFKTAEKLRKRLGISYDKIAIETGIVFRRRSEG